MRIEDVITDEFMHSKIAEKVKNVYIIGDMFYDFKTKKPKPTFRILIRNGFIEEIAKNLLIPFTNLLYGELVANKIQSFLIELDLKDTVINSVMSLYNIKNQDFIVDLKRTNDDAIDNTVNLLFNTIHAGLKRKNVNEEFDKYIPDYFHFGRCVYLYQNEKMTLDEVRNYMLTVDPFITNTNK